MLISRSRDKEAAEKIYLADCHLTLHRLAKEELDLAERFWFQHKLGAETGEILNDLYKSVVWEYKHQEYSKKPEVEKYFTYDEIYYYTD